MTKVQARLSRCSKVVAAVAIGGIAFSVFPFIVGAPDFENMPPPPHHRGGKDGHEQRNRGEQTPPSIVDYLTGYKAPSSPEFSENQNEKREQDRLDNDDEYEKFIGDRWNDQDNESSSDLVNKKPVLEQGHPDHRSPPPPPPPHQDVKDYFYRFNFFAMLKWICVLSGALIAKRTSRQTEFKSW